MFFILKLAAATIICVLVIQAVRMTRFIINTSHDDPSFIKAFITVLGTPISTESNMSLRGVFKYYRDLSSGKMLTEYRKYKSANKVFAIECPHEMRSDIIKDFSHRYLVLENSKRAENVDQFKAHIHQQTTFLIALLEEDVDALIASPENTTFYKEEPVAYHLIVGVSEVAKRYKVSSDVVVAISLAYVQHIDLDCELHKAKLMV